MKLFYNNDSSNGRARNQKDSSFLLVNLFVGRFRERDEINRSLIDWKKLWSYICGWYISFFFFRGGKIDGAIYIYIDIPLFSFDRILVTISNDLTLMAIDVSWLNIFLLEYSGKLLDRSSFFSSSR